MIIGAVVLATPLTVEVKRLAEVETALELIRLTPVPATPLTVVVRVLTVELLATELIRLTGVIATPLILPLRLLAAEVRLAELIIGAVAIVPSTVEVMVFTALAKVLVIGPLLRLA